MHLSHRLCHSRWSQCPGCGSFTLLSACLVGLLAVHPAAMAVDGCLVLLCFAAPSWRSIPQCVPPITQVLRDLARGKTFPTCAISGAGNRAAHQWANPPSFCPPQYTRLIDDVGMPTYICDYVGAVAVDIDGALWTRTWWRFNGDTVTEYTEAAKASLGWWDPKFDEDYAAWLTTQPPPCMDCGS